MIAASALELAAGGDAVGLNAAAARADRLAIVVSPANLAERAVRFFLAALIDGLQGEGAGGGAEEEVLGHLSSFPMRMHHI